MSRRRLYRSHDRIVGGVSSGIADYFGIDPTIVRLAWVLLALLNGFGFIFYLICWIVIPPAPYGRMP